MYDACSMLRCLRPRARVFPWISPVFSHCLWCLHSAASKSGCLHMWIQYTPPAAKSTYTQHSCCFQVHVAHYVTQFRFENLSIEPASQYHVGTTCQNGRTEQGCRLIFNRLQNQLGRCVLHLTIHINPSEKVSTYIPYPPAKKKWE